MTIKATLSRTGTIGGKVAGTNNVRVKQVAIGNSSSSVNLSAKSINELADVNAAEADDNFLQYNASTDKWESTNTIDGGTF